MAALKESLMSNASGGAGGNSGGSSIQVGVPDVSVKLPEVHFQLPDVSLPDTVSLPEVSLPDVSKGLEGISSAVQSGADQLGKSTEALGSWTVSLVDKEIGVLLNAIRAAGDSLLSQVPPGARDQALKAASLLGDSLDAFEQNPTGYSIVLGATLGLPLLLAYNAAYGGYNGVLKPSKAMEMLQDGDALLIDVRSPEERKQDGVPLLKLAARGKGVALPYPVLSPSVTRQVHDAQALATEMLGQQIRSVAKLNPQTKVIIMDRKGEMAKEIARSCRAAGVRCVYMLEGGFSGYRRQEGLAIDGKDFYEDGPLALAADTAESLGAGLGQIFSDRKNSAIAFAAVALSAFTAANLHEVLKFVGVLGLEATVVLRYVVGDEEISEDFQRALGSVSGAVDAARRLQERASSTRKTSS